MRTGRHVTLGPLTVERQNVGPMRGSGAALPSTLLIILFVLALAHLESLLGAIGVETYFRYGVPVWRAHSDRRTPDLLAEAASPRLSYPWFGPGAAGVWRNEAGWGWVVQALRGHIRDEAGRSTLTLFVGYWVPAAVLAALWSPVGLVIVGLAAISALFDLAYVTRLTVLFCRSHHEQRTRP